MPSDILPKTVGMPAPPPRLDTSKPPAPSQDWTIWQEAESVMAALDRLAAHIRHTRNELERNLMETERLMGSVTKPKQ